MRRPRSGCTYGAGFVVNFNDIAGRYAGLAFGLANTPGSIAGILGPSLVGLIVKSNVYIILHSFRHNHFLFYFISVFHR